MYNAVWSIQERSYSTIGVGGGVEGMWHVLCKSDSFSLLFRGIIMPLSSSYNISGLVPACWLLFQCF